MKHETKWTFIIIGIFLIWGSFYPVSKYIVTDLDPPIVAFLRYLWAVLALTPLFIYKVRSHTFPSITHSAEMGLLGVLGITLFALLLFYGIKLSSSSVSSILANTQPLFGPGLAWLILKEKFSLRQLVGILIGTAGMAVVVLESGATGDGHASSAVATGLLGNIYCILASVAISLYYILLKKHIQRYGSIVATYISFFAGGAGLFVVAMALGSDFHSLKNLSLFEWVLIFYNGTVATAFVYIIHNVSIVQIGVVRTLRLKFLIPVFGVILSVVLLQESVGLTVMGGMLIVLLAICMLQWPEK